MTFTEIVDSVAERLNLSSSTATARIGRNVNDRYRRLTSSVGLNTSRRSTDTQNTTVDYPHVTFSLEKIEVVYTIADGKRRVLGEISYDEWRALDTLTSLSGDPDNYAIEQVGASSVTIALDKSPSSILELRADGLANASTLSGVQVPSFPADFHDALVFGAMSDEYAKMDNKKQQDYYEMQFENRVSELRYFLAKSAYLSIHQGPRESNRLGRPSRYWYV